MSIVCLLRARVGSQAWKSIIQKQRVLSWSDAPFSSLLCAKPQHIFNTPSCHYSNASTANDNAQWYPIYRLPIIRLAAAFNRLKLYQGLLTALATPAVFALEQAGHLFANAGLVVGSVGFSGLLTLSLASLVVRNVVGFIYVNEEGDKVKLAYVDYWGKRQHVVANVNDIVPETDWLATQAAPFEFYQKIRIEGEQKQAFKVLQRYGVILEPETFAQLFGE